MLLRAESSRSCWHRNRATHNFITVILIFACDPDYRGTGPLKTTMDVIDAAKVWQPIYGTWTDSNSASVFFHFIHLVSWFYWCLVKAIQNKSNQVVLIASSLSQRIAKAGAKMNQKASEIVQRVSSVWFPFWSEFADGLQGPSVCVQAVLPRLSSNFRR